MSWVAIAIASLALLLALAARGEARRLRRALEALPPAAPPPPPPPPPLEDGALRRVLETDVEAREVLAGRVARLEAAQQEVEGLEARLGDRLQALAAATAVEEPARPAPPPPPASADLVAPEARVREALAEQGYEGVVVMPHAGGDPSRYLVEAQRRGVTVKGHAVVGEDAQVDLHLRPALGVFP